MGFYNIYKILKDMIRTIFGRKVLKIITIFLLFLIILLICNKCFAITSFNPNFQYNGLTFTTSNINSWSSGISSSPFTGSMDKMVILRYKIYQNGYSYRYTCIRCSYPIYITSLSGRNEPMCRIYSKNNNTNTYMKMATSSARETSTTISFGDFSNTNDAYMDGNFSNNISIEGPIEVFYSNVDVYKDNNIIYQDYTNPSLGNSQTQLENLSFSNFIINANSYTQDIENNDGTLFMLIYNRSLSNSQTTDGLYPIREIPFTKGSIYTDYDNSTTNNIVFSLPIFKSGVYFNIGSTYEIRLAKKVYNSEYNTMVYEYFGNPIQFTISSNVTQDYINQLNQQTATSTDNEITQDLQNSINNQTQIIDNINNSITDSSIDNSSINLPTDNTNDPTQSGVDNIFQTIYNSFTSGTPQDIIFPIPNTNQNITLSANYTYNSLQTNNLSWLITIIQAFWWYLISRFIITDIMQKVRKIKQGNLDNIENSNIKEDML